MPAALAQQFRHSRLLSSNPLHWPHQREASTRAGVQSGQEGIGLAAAVRISFSRMRPLRPDPWRVDQSTEFGGHPQRPRTDSYGRGVGRQQPSGGDPAADGSANPAGSAKVWKRPWAGRGIRHGQKLVGGDKMTEQDTHPDGIARFRAVRRDAQDAAVDRLDVLGRLVAFEAEQRLACPDGSPSCFSQPTKSPSSMFQPRRGTVISMAMRLFLHQLADRPDDVVHVRD